jgi:integrase
VDISPEMRLFSPDGARLYLNDQERTAFLAALDEESPQDRLFCQVLHYSGCRPTEALQLVPKRVLIGEQSLVFRSLKKRKVDGKGREKQPQYRAVPVPELLIERIDLVFDVRAKQKRGQGLDTPFWPISRPTAYRLVKRVMDRAGISGKQATGKGLRHGFGVAMVTAKKPLPCTCCRN